MGLPVHVKFWEPRANCNSGFRPTYTFLTPVLPVNFGAQSEDCSHLMKRRWG